MDDIMGCCCDKNSYQSMKMTNYVNFPMLDEMTTPYLEMI